MESNITRSVKTMHTRTLTQQLYFWFSSLDIIIQKYKNIRTNKIFILVVEHDWKQMK